MDMATTTHKEQAMTTTTDTIYPLSYADRSTILRAADHVLRMDACDIQDVMGAPWAKAKTKLVGLYDVLGDDAATCDTLITARRALIEASLTDTDGDQDAYRILNVKLAAMLEGVTI